MDTISVSKNGRDNGNNEGKGITLKSLQKHLAHLIIGAIGGAAILTIVFYFNTNYTLQAHTLQLNAADKRMDMNDAKVESIQTDLTTIKSQMSDMKESLTDMKATESTTQQDIKKIYDILLSMKK